MESLVIVIYSAIIFGTIFAQFSKSFQKSNKYDFLLFINIFKLFSPKPVSVDIRIFYRDLFEDDNVTDLLEFKYYSKTSIKNTLWFFGNAEFYIISRCLKVISQMNRQNISEDRIFESKFYKKIQFEVLKLSRDSRKIKSRQIIFISHKSYTENQNSHIYLIKNIKLKR